MFLITIKVLSDLNANYFTYPIPGVVLSKIIPHMWLFFLTIAGFSLRIPPRRSSLKATGKHTLIAGANFPKRFEKFERDQETIVNHFMVVSICFLWT